MDEIGHILREAREARGLTLGEAQAQTRINSRFLEALENGEYGVLPSPVHARGFLRNYARFLALDPTPLLERYEVFQRQQPQSARQPVSETLLTPDPLYLRDEQPFFDPVNVELDKRSSNGDPESLLRLVIILALIVFLGLVLARFVPLLMGQGDGTVSLTQSINQVWQDITSGVGSGAEATPMSEEENPSTDTGSDEPIQNTSRNDFGAVAGTPFPTPFPTRPSLPATMESIDLRLDIGERTWMEVTVDGDVRFSGWAKRGDVFEWTAEDEVYLRTGNAYGIIATINNIELGRLGEFQEAREETWRTTQ